MRISDKRYDMKWMLVALVAALLGAMFCSIGFWPKDALQELALMLLRVMFVLGGGLLFLSAAAFFVFLALED